MTDPQTAGIAIRVWAWAATLRVLKRIVPLESLVRMMHRAPGSAPRSAAFERRLAEYLLREGRFPFRPPSNCLERSLASYRLLGRAGAQPELVVGFRPSPIKHIEGHVWVIVDGRPFAERDVAVGTYTAAVTFDSSACRRPDAGASLPAGIQFR
jgi:transglutaminase superfamily protein